jgi:surfactin synthase thioesterase subunit/malonyl CoA-acyl carrier protein transacylase
MPIVLCTSGRLARDELQRPAYYAEQARQPVRFTDAMTTLRELHAEIFLELGPSSTLSGLVRRGASSEVRVIPSLRAPSHDGEGHPADELSQVQTSLASLFVAGVALQPTALYQDESRRKLALPTYPFQRRRYAIDPPASAMSQASPRAPLGSLLGRRLCSPALPSGTAVFETTLCAAELPLLADHSIYGHIVVSGTVHLHLVAQALASISGAATGQVFTEVQFERPLLLPDGDAFAARTVQTILQQLPIAAEGFCFQVVSIDEDAAAGAIVHTTGKVRPLDAARDLVPGDRDLSAIRNRCTEARGGPDFYRELWRPGEHHLGDSFRTIAQLHRRDGEALVEIALPPETALRPAGCALPLPLLADISIGEVYGQALMPATPDYDRLARETEHTFVGQSAARSRVFSPTVHQARYAHAVVTSFDGSLLRGDVALLSESGAVLSIVEGLTVRRLERSVLQAAVARAARGEKRSTGAARQAQLRAGTVEEARVLAADYLRAQVAALLGSDPRQVDLDRSLAEVGVDSLLAVELRAVVQSDLGQAPAIAELLSGQSLRQLAVSLTAQARTAQEAPVAAPVATSTEVALPPHSDRWLRRILIAKSSPEMLALAAPPVRLICFPHGGGGPAAFIPWRRVLPADAEVYVVQAPGREERLREPPIVSWPQLLDELATALRPLFDRPCAFFGASLGALLAYELTRELRRRGAPLPRALLVAASPAPHHELSQITGIDPLRRALHATGAQLLPELRALGTIPEALLQESAALELMMPALRADLSLFLSYRHRPEPPLPLPIHAFGGRQDVMIKPQLLSGWAEHSDEISAVHLLPGEHLFYRSHAQQLLPLLFSALSQAAS